MNINQNLRKLFALLAGIFLLFKLIEKIDIREEEEESFLSREFDDIW